jgi:hypothetical protein
MRGVGAAGAIAIARSVDRVTAKAEVVRHTAAIEFREDGVERKVAGGPPTAFRIWKSGTVVTDHGTHALTKGSVAQLLEDQKTRGNLFSIDVDHMSLSDNAPPENHKAVGWFSIEERGGDLWAVNVEWTDAVRDGFSKSPPEWRYFSPAYETTKKDGEIVRLLNMALTNNPATHRVTALASQNITKEKAAMADDDKKDEKKEETLGQMIAAFEAEPDEEKRSAMKSAIRAKYKAAFGDDEDEKKKDDDEKSTKSTKANGGDDEKKETKASEDAEKCAANIADKALERFETARKAKEDQAEKDRILAKLPAGEREDYKDLSLDQVRRVVGRHHKDALASFTATTNANPTIGSNVTHAAMGTDEERRLDRMMGLGGEQPIITESGGRLTFHGGTPQQATRFLASIAKEQEKGASEREALTRVFATQNGGVR